MISFCNSHRGLQLASLRTCGWEQIVQREDLCPASRRWPGRRQDCSAEPTLLLYIRHICAAGLHPTVHYVYVKAVTLPRIPQASNLEGPIIQIKPQISKARVSLSPRRGGSHIGCNVWCYVSTWGEALWRRPHFTRRLLRARRKPNKEVKPYSA